MSYIQRRGDTFFFRIAVPNDLRPHFGGREITRTLRTALKTQATPLALEYAASAKRLFIEIRAAMGNDTKLLELLNQRKQQFRLDEQRDQHQDEIDELERKHKHELKLARLEAEAETMRRVMAGLQAQSLANPPISHEMPVVAAASGPVPMFHQVVDEFISYSGKTGAKSMLIKVNATMGLLKEYISDIPVTSLRQKHLNEFFTMLCRLPNDWKQQARRLLAASNFRRNLASTV